MASDINTVTMSGNLTRDAEVRYTNSGYPVIGFSIASNQNRKVGDNWEDVTHYFDVTVFGREKLAQYLTKGKKVFFSGRAEQQRWEKDGQKRSAVKFVADDIVLAGDRGDSPKGAPAQRTPQSPREEQDDIFPDDLPF